MRIKVNESIKETIKEAIVSGKLDLLDIPEMGPLLKNYVEDIEHLNDIIRKSENREGIKYLPGPITALVEVKDRVSIVALLSALQSCVLEVPDIWIEKADEMNKTNLFLEIMKEMAKEKGPKKLTNKMIMENDVIEMIKEEVRAQIQPLIDVLDKLAEKQDPVKIASETKKSEELKKQENTQETKIGRFTMSEIRAVRDARKAQENSHIHSVIRGLDVEQTATKIRGLKK